MIQSRYKLIQFFAVLILLLLPILIVWAASKADKGLVAAICISFLFAYLLFLLLKRSPQIVLDEEFISARTLFRERMYTWTSVRQVWISRKEHYKMLGFLGQDVEATTLIFDDNEKLILWDGMYSNLAELKRFIAEKAGDKIQDRRPAFNRSRGFNIEGKVYAGNPYTSFNTLLLVGMTIFFICMIGQKMKFNLALFIPVGFLLLLYLFMGLQMNYFVIEDEYLYVRNHYFPWKKISFSLDDLQGLAVETPHKRSTCLRVTTKSFVSKLYGAGSLRDKHWQELIQDLNAVGVPTRRDS